MRFFKPLIVLLSTLMLASCHNSNEDNCEDKIVKDLNDVFDPKHEGETDWNYTEIDEEWLEDVGIYYDNKSNTYRQRTTIQKQKKESKPINPITINLIFIGGCFLLFELWLLYATYKQAADKHRIIWVWLFNSFVGGVWSFIILSLSKGLRYNEKLDIRGETDLLGITIALGNITLFIFLYLVIRLYLVISANPRILADFLE